MTYLLYNLCLVGYFLVAGPYYLLHVLLREHYRAGLAQRLGFSPKARRTAPCVWFHGVSVGEIQTLIEMGERLRRDMPALHPVYSTTTLTAQRIARSRLGEDADILYYPLDLPFAVSRALDRVRPSLVVLAETELWPNFLRRCHARKIPVVLVNGRISDRSFRGYRLMRFFTRVFLPWIDLCLMQNSVYAERIIALGAPSERVRVTGNMKADVDTVEKDAPRDLQALFEQLRAAPNAAVLVAGSTHPGEEAVLARIYSRIKHDFPSLILVLAPRHLDRVEGIEQELRQSGLVCVRRSHWNGLAWKPGVVLLLDTLGELPWVYQWADLVFIGKSLRGQGGQNPLEAARLAKPVLFGPRMENFPKEVAELLKTEGAVQVADERVLEQTVGVLLRDAPRLLRMGQQAKSAVMQLRGAIGLNAEILRKKLSEIRF